MTHLFLTGPSGVGKSTLLFQALSDIDLTVSGIFTQRLIYEDGSPAGFRLLPWSSGLPATSFYTPGLPDIFISRTNDGWSKNLKVFAETGAALLDSASCCNIICLDEIGGAELLVPEFRARLYHTLHTHPCCIGVIKGAANLSSMSHTLELPFPEAQILSQFHRDLTEQFHSQILNVTCTNKKQVAESLRSFLYRGDANDI